MTFLTQCIIYIIIDNEFSENTFGKLNNVTNGCLGCGDFPWKKKSRKNLYIYVAVATAIVIIGLGVGLGLQKSEEGKIMELLSL